MRVTSPTNRSPSMTMGTSPSAKSGPRASSGVEGVTVSSREAIRVHFRQVAPDVSVEIDFEEDSHAIHQLLRQADFGHKPPILFGTTWERDLAKELKGAIVEVGFPASYEVVLARSYVGYRGALQLLERIYTTAVSASA